MLKTLKINQQWRSVAETDDHANLGTVIGIHYSSIACIVFRDLQTNQHRGRLKAKNHCDSSYKCPHPGHFRTLIFTVVLKDPAGPVSGIKMNEYELT